VRDAGLKGRVVHGDHGRHVVLTQAFFQPPHTLGSQRTAPFAWDYGVHCDQPDATQVDHILQERAVRAEVCKAWLGKSLTLALSLIVARRILKVRFVKSHFRVSSDTLASAIAKRN
jgi:hypothetical protein